MDSSINFCLVLTIRNSKDLITQSIDTVINLIDEYVICDASSNGDVTEKIGEYMSKHGKSGHCFQAPWKDHGYNKSYTFKEAHENSDAKYFIWLEPGDMLKTKNNEPLTRDHVRQLVNYLDAQDNLQGVKLSVHQENVWTPEILIARNDKLYYWEYPTHEQLRSHETGHTCFTDLLYVDRPSEKLSDEQKSERINWFKNYLYQHPNDSYALFYLGYYLELDMKYGGAIENFEKCIEVTEDKDMKYVSHLHIGRINRYKLFSYQIAATHFGLGDKVCPDRLECAYEFLCLLEVTKEFKSGIPFISFDRAKTPIDNQRFMFETCVYNWRYSMESSFISHKAGNNEIAIEIGTYLKDSGKYPPEKANPVEQNIYWFKKALENPPVPTTQETRSVPRQISPDSTGKTITFGDFKVRDQRVQSIVIDNFFEDPDKVREFALSQEYKVRGNYPGARTQCFAHESHKQFFEKVLNRKITHWPAGYNGTFQYTTGEMKSWIHRDMTDYSALIYLTPDAPLDAGTRVYRHRETGYTYGTGETNDILNKDSGNEAAWDVVEEVRNVYNRCIIFDGRRSHKSHEYFGTNLENGRLFMVFFFDVEK